MPDHEDMHGKVSRGLAWVGAASSAVAALDLVAHFILIAVWINEEQLGVAVYAFALFPVLDIATDLGLTAAVVQRDDHTEEKLSTLFWLNLAMSGMLAALLVFGVGPLLAWIYKRPIVAGLLGVYAIKLIWQNVYYIPYALMKKELRFKELSVIRMLANLAEFAGKIGFAWAGYGIWCFVAGPLCRVAVTGVAIQIVHPWRPKFVLRIREAWHWLVFGMKASAHEMLFHLYSNVDYHIVGYYFGEKAAGLYANAYLVVLEPCRFISEVVRNTAFPVFSRVKDKPKLVFEQFVMLTRMNMVVVMGFLGIVFVAAPDILYLIKPPWAQAADVVRLLCVVGVLRAMSFVVPPMLDGTGHPGKTLIYTIVAAVAVPALFVGSAKLLGPEYGYKSVAYGWLFGYPIAFVVLYVMAFRVLDMPGLEFIRRVARVAVVAVVATAAAGLVSWLAHPAPRLVRVLAVVVTMVGVFGVLLARVEGISPRSVAKSLKS